MPQRCPFLKIFLCFFAKINDRRTTFNCEAWCIVGIWRRGHWTCIWLIFQPKWECWGLWLIWFADIGILCEGHLIFCSLQIVFTSKQSGESNCCRSWTTELCRNGSPPLIMSKVGYLDIKSCLSPCSYSSHPRHNESRCHVTPVTCHEDCHSVVTNWQLTSGEWSALDSSGLSGLVIDKTWSYFYVYAFIKLKPFSYSIPYTTLL